MRSPIALLALVVLSIGILTPVSAAVPQGGTRSPEVRITGGPAPARMNAPSKNVRRPNGLGDSGTMELVAGLTLQGVLFLIIGYLWTQPSHRRGVALETAVGREDSMKQSPGSTDAEDSPATAASKAS